MLILLLLLHAVLFGLVRGSAPYIADEYFPLKVRYGRSIDDQILWPCYDSSRRRMHIINRILTLNPNDSISSFTPVTLTPWFTERGNATAYCTPSRG